MEKQENNKSGKLNRRDFLAGLAGIPILGGLFAAHLAEQSGRASGKSNILTDLELDSIETPEFDFSGKGKGDLIRLGIIGVGSRGTSILESLGFNGSNLQDTSHGDLNVQLTGVCDVYDVHAQKGEEISQYNKYALSRKKYPAAKRFRNYTEMLESNEVDATRFQQSEAKQVSEIPDMWPEHHTTVRIGTPD